MRFLLKAAFWLTIVLILLPSGGTKDSQTGTEQISASEAVSAASAAVSDMRGFCARQPDACTVGSQVAVALGQKAQAGAKMLYEFLNEKLATREPRSAAATNGGTSQHTLTPADLAPAWRAPASRKDADSRV